MKRAQTLVRARLDSHLVLHASDLPNEAHDEIKSMFTRSNPLFHKKKAMGHWLGDTPSKIQSWTREGMFYILPRGARKSVEDMLANYDCVLDSVKDKTACFKPANFKLTKRSVLRPYQEKAVDALIENGGGTIRGPCGSGKTVILIGAIARLNQPALVVVHSKLLAQQWRGAVNAWLGFQPGSIEGGKKKTLRPITVATQQALWALLSKGDLEWTQFFGTFAGDEIHRWAANTFRIVANAMPAKYRIGASADERRKDGMEHLVYETFSKPVYKIKKAELIELGSLLPTRMELIETEFFDEVYQASLDNKEIPDWVSFVTRLSVDGERNSLILSHIYRVIYFSSLLRSSFKKETEDLIERYIHHPSIFNKKRGPPYNDGIEENPRILLLTDRVPAAIEWVEKLRKAHVPAGLMVGGVKHKEELFETVAGLKNGNLIIGVGTSVADEGLDIPPLTHVFVTCPVHKHLKRLEQMVGRSARCSKGKKVGKCVYFWDSRMFPYRNPKDSEMKFDRKRTTFLRRFKKSVTEVELFTV